MNDLQNSILESISILAKSASQSTPTTVTIEAVVLNAIDSGSGLYLVEYLGNKFQAYSDVTSKYSSGELVYVLVPNGDFTKNKVILRAVTPTAKNYMDVSQEAQYNTMTQDLLECQYEVALSSYYNEIVDFTANGANLYLEKIAKNLQRYIRSGIKKFKLSLSVKTDIVAQSHGNYGLLLTIPTTDGDRKQYNLTVRDITGNPYSLNTWTDQSKIIEIDNIDKDRFDEISIAAFVDGFIQNEELKDRYDIFFKNIELFGVETYTKKEDATSYKLTLAASDGSLFFSESDKTILPTLFINNQETELSGFDCYWFEEDALITYTSQEYMPQGDVGWRCVNKKTSMSIGSLGEQDIQYNLEEYFYTILYSAFDGVFSKRYKCVVDYNGVWVSKIIEIKNYYSQPFEMNLYPTSKSTNVVKGSKVFLTCELTGIDAELSQNLAYLWYRYDSQGNFIQDNFVEYIKQGTGTIEVSFLSEDIDVINTIRCFVYTVDSTTRGLKLLASDSVNISTIEDGGYYMTVSPENILYKYDSDGDSPLIADYDGPSPVKGIEPLKVHIYKADGTELTDAEYDMATIRWVLETESMYVPGYAPIDADAAILEFDKRDFPYVIANTFNKEKADKKLFVEVQIDDSFLVYEPNIQFIKEGSSGLNGSKYTALISYGGNAYDPFSTKRGKNLTIIRKTANDVISWYAYKGNDIVELENAYPLTIKVYRDSAIISPDNYFVHWSLFDNDYDSAFVVEENDNGEAVVKVESSEGSVHCVVQAQITIFNPSDTDTLEELYCYYPIDVITYEHDKFNPQDLLLPTITGGFNIVEYMQDGTNPQYDTTKNFQLVCEYDSGNEINRFNSNDVWKVSDINMLTIDSKAVSYGKRIVPVTRFDSTVKELLVSAEVTTKDIDNATPKPADITAEIAKLQRNQEYTKSLLEYTNTEIYTNNWLINLSACGDLLFYRENLFISLNRLTQIIDDILKIRERSEQALSLKEQLNQALEKLYSFQKPFENYLLNLKYEPTVADTAVTKLLGSDFNREINIFNVACNNLIKYAQQQDLDEKAYSAYNKIKAVSVDNIPNMPSIDDGDFIDQYKILSTKITDIINGVKYQTSTNLLHDYFQQLAVTLNNYGVWTNQTCSLAQSVVSSFEKQIKDLTDNYNAVYATHICDIKQQNSADIVFTLYRPIIFIYNRTGLATVQGWDGNKLYVSQGNKDEYLTTIQSAIGKSSSTQTFSAREAEPAGFDGIALGTQVKKDEHGVEVKQQGLYGYYKGQQTFMLNATTGIASFGKGNSGQIIIDPSSGDAILKSGDYIAPTFKRDNNGEIIVDVNGIPVVDFEKNQGRGMEINLSKPTMIYGNGNFMLNEHGNLVVNNATVRGHVEAESGHFKGTIEADKDSKFANITAEGVTLTGKITATEGQFGNLKILSDGRMVIVAKDGSENNFITENGTLNTEGELFTAVGSNIGGWSVIAGQKLQGTGTTSVTLDPITNSIYYNNNNMSPTFSDAIENGFYLGKDGFVVPNALFVKPNANTDNKYWEVNSNDITWKGSTTKTLKFGANGVNLFDKFLVSNEGHIQINSDQIVCGNDTILASGKKFDVQTNSLTGIFNEDVSLTSKKNYLLNFNNIKLTASNFNFSSLIEGGSTNGVSSLLIKANTVTLGNDNDIVITTDTVTMKQNEQIVLGKAATFTKSVSKIHNSTETAKVEVDANNVNIIAPTQISFGDEVIITDDNIDVKAKNIKIVGGTLSDINLKIEKNTIELNKVKITGSAIEATVNTTLTGELKNVGNTTLQGNVTVTGNTTVSGPVKSSGDISGTSVTIGQTTFTEAELIQLKQLLQSLN